MSEDFDLDGFRDSVEGVMNDDHDTHVMDETLVDLINIIRLNEVAAKAMSDKARKDQVTRVLDKLFAAEYSEGESNK